MLRERRHALIVEQLRLNGAASINDLSAEIGASGSTIRRDLKLMAGRGLVQLAYGGAILPASYLAAFEMDSASAAEVAPHEKAAIGKLAVSLLSPGQTVLFDSSTTVLAAAKSVVAQDLQITAITNSLEIGSCLSHARNTEVIVVGGRVRAGSPTLTGVPGLDFFAELHADIALLGTHAISGTLLTETSLDVVATKRAMLSSARRSIVLADSTKFQPPALFTICDIRDIDEIITNDSINEDALSIIRDAGAKVRLAAAPR